MLPSTIAGVQVSRCASLIRRSGGLDRDGPRKGQGVTLDEATFAAAPRLSGADAPTGRGARTLVRLSARAMSSGSKQFTRCKRSLTRHDDRPLAEHGARRGCADSRPDDGDVPLPEIQPVRRRTPHEAQTIGRYRPVVDRCCPLRQVVSRRRRTSHKPEDRRRRPDRGQKSAINR